MAKKLPQLDDGLISLIERQNIFFTASSAGDGRVNVLPRSMLHFRVIDQHNVFYLDFSGSGNETAAHARASGQATIMFCAFDGSPRILKLYLGQPSKGDLVFQSGFHRQTINFQAYELILRRTSERQTSLRSLLLDKGAVPRSQRY